MARITYLLTVRLGISSLLLCRHSRIHYIQHLLLVLLFLPNGVTPRVCFLFWLGRLLCEVFCLLRQAMEVFSVLRTVN